MSQTHADLAVLRLEKSLRAEREEKERLLAELRAARREAHALLVLMLLAGRPAPAPPPKPPRRGIMALLHRTYPEFYAPKA